MKVFGIRLRSIQEVESFVRAVSAFDFQVDLKSERYVVDAKSIMGILSLDLASLIKLEAYADDWDEFERAVKPFEAVV